MSKIKGNTFEEYFKHINEEFALANKKLKNLIRNPQALGSENESILREFIKNYIPNHYSVGHGFIFKNSDEISSQCDIIIYDSSFFAPLFKQGDFVVLLPESVITVIEVKTEIKTGKDFLDSAIDNIKSARALNNRISGLIFAFRGSYPYTILNGITRYSKTKKVELKGTFELMVNLERGYCIVLKREDNGKILFNLDTTLDNIETDFVFSVNDTGKKSFYLFYYYILRQIRTYVFNTFIMTGTKSPFLSDFSFIQSVPTGGLDFKGYFDTRKDKVKKLIRKPIFDNNNELLGVSSREPNT